MQSQSRLETGLPLADPHMKYTNSVFLVQFYIFNGLFDLSLDRQGAVIPAATA